MRVLTQLRYLIIPPVVDSRGNLERRFRATTVDSGQGGVQYSSRFAAPRATVVHSPSMVRIARAAVGNLAAIDARASWSPWPASISARSPMLGLCPISNTPAAAEGSRRTRSSNSSTSAPYRASSIVTDVLDGNAGRISRNVSTVRTADEHTTTSGSEGESRRCSRERDPRLCARVATVAGRGRRGQAGPSSTWRGATGEADAWSMHLRDELVRPVLRRAEVHEHLDATANHELQRWVADSPSGRRSAFARDQHRLAGLHDPSVPRPSVPLPCRASWQNTSGTPPQWPRRLTRRDQSADRTRGVACAGSSLRRSGRVHAT